MFIKIMKTQIYARPFCNMKWRILDSQILDEIPILLSIFFAYQSKRPQVKTSPGQNVPNCSQKRPNKISETRGTKHANVTILNINIMPNRVLVEYSHYIMMFLFFPRCNC